MRKYVKLTLCGLAAAMLIAGCSKKEDTQTTPAETTEESQAATDRGKVTKLGIYKGVEVTKSSTEVTDEELDTRIQGILDANPEYIEVTDRAAKLGDTVDIDYVGMRDGVAFEGGTAEGYKLELGSNSFIDGFEDGLVGAETGAELSLNLTFPDPYPNNPDLAGKPVVFDVTVNGIEEKKEAVLDDNFVQRISDMATADEFKADTLADMEAEKEEQANRQIESDALLAAIENSEYDISQEAIDELFNNQLDYYTSMVQAYGMTLEDYVTMFGMTEDQFKEEIKNSAELAIKQQLLSQAIAEAEGLTVEDADRQPIADQYGMDIKTLQDTYGAEAVDEQAMMIKVRDFIKENAVVK